MPYSLEKEMETLPERSGHLAESLPQILKANMKATYNNELNQWMDKSKHGTN